ncbi:protein translocase subunit SecD [Pseudoxanthobacter sp.]|uniref:protein translocase subunit SecD n=1 Tax=Pseudoxanthobacter sp. TaxID=1925742 RepID=UPI002FE36A8E
MLYLSRWKIALILAVVLGGFVVLLPNFFSRETVANWPAFMPKRQIVLGLDLQGGVYLLYEVDREDYIQKRLKTLTGEVRGALREEPRIGFTDLAVKGDAVTVRIRDMNQLAEARKRLDELRNPLSSSLFGAKPVDEFRVEVADNGVARLSFTQQGLEQRVRSIVDQSIGVIARRVDELGTVEPNIQRQGADRILVEAPGLDDPDRLKAIVGQTAQLTFHLVDTSINPQTVIQSKPPAGTMLLYSVNDPPVPYVVEEAPLLTGDDLVDAQATFEPTNHEPVVSFRLSTAGSRKFATITQQNVGRPFAIVLDNEVISAPNIREPILGGAGQISGNFTVETANDLAVLLRAGALPAKLTIVEERTIGPGLGEDSIRAGEIASIIATIAVCIYMFAVYRFFGLLANIAVVVNVMLIFALITLLGATLTLPGIAGIVLTVGTAVDSNVLIYERIREEARNGRSAIMAIDTGFRRAIGTILDANITMFISAIVLFYLGSGPIRGFAVTHALGIITTMFTAVTFTRMLVVFWVRLRRPTKISI